MIVYDPGRFGVSRSLWRLKGCVFPRAALMALGPSLVTLILSSIIQATVDRADIEEQASSDTLLRLHATFTWVFGFVLVFRTGVAWNRYWEGATQMKVMSCEWYDACAEIINFVQVGGKSTNETKGYQGACVRLFSLLHCLALQKICICQDESFDVVDLEGLDPDLLKGLQTLDDPMEKTEVVFQWIHRLIIEGMKQGYIVTPPPIVTRCFQELNSGMLALCKMAAITDTPFPFPYAQMLSSLLVLQACTTPILLGTAAVHPLFSTIFAFISVFALCSLNLIAQEIEQPFGDDHNDLECIEAQRVINCSLLLLLDPLTQSCPNFDPIRATTMKRLTKTTEIISRNNDGSALLAVEEERLYRSSQSGMSPGTPPNKTLSKSVTKTRLMVEEKKKVRDPKFPDSQPEPEKSADKGREQQKEPTPAIPVHVDAVKPEILKPTPMTGNAPQPPSPDPQWLQEFEACAYRIESTLSQSFQKMCAVQESISQLVRLATENGSNTYQLMQLATDPGILVRSAVIEALPRDYDQYTPATQETRPKSRGGLCSLEPCRVRSELPEVEKEPTRAV